MDDLIYLTKEVEQRKLEDYKMQLSIVQNPHTKNPKELWRLLDAQGRKSSSEKLDRAGFQLMKQKMSGNPRIIVKSNKDGI